MTGFAESALLLLGHGSTKNANSSLPTWILADTLRERSVFSSVHCAFWKEEPGFRQIYPSIEESSIYAVPHFIGEGYFTREIIPRELMLDGPHTDRDGRSVFYCDPVGTHPAMTRLLARRALDLIGDSTDAAKNALIVAGHGTPRNSRSKATLLHHVERLRELDLPFAEIGEAFMEEPPFISDWKTRTDAENVVVVPFFIADGLHSFEEIPRMLGIPPHPGEGAPGTGPSSPLRHRIGNRNLSYGRAIGLDPGMADVILDLVTDFQNRHLHEKAG